VVLARKSDSQAASHVEKRARHGMVMKLVPLRSFDHADFAQLKTQDFLFLKPLKVSFDFSAIRR
jgi:hypothetical protein